MNDLNQLFFELIQVATGTRICLSHTPSADEWGELYAMAKKQSLVGVCFAGVQKLQAQRQEPPEMLYITWMGIAAKIQQRNEVVTAQCKELLGKMASDGIVCRLLKGQGVAALYNDNLRLLRQSGDIDVWIVPNDNTTEDKHFKKVMQYVNGIAETSDLNRQHVQLPIYSDTEVEVHFMPSRMNNPWRNERLQKFCREKGKEYVEKDGMVMPTTEFNLVYLLQHCYNHLLFEGVGLRQVMDYYFTLRARNSNDNDNILHTLKTLGLLKFAGAMMWVLAHVFAMEHEYMICEPNEKEGRLLLNEVMTGGNFGKYGKDGVMEGHAKGKVAFFMARMKRNWRFLTHYPSEIIWSPYAMLSHWMWKRNLKI